METCLQPRNQLRALLQLLHCLGDHLVHDGLSGLLIVDDGSDLTHQERVRVIQNFIVELVVTLQFLHFIFKGNYSLTRQLRNLVPTIGLPVRNVRVVADSQRPTGEDDGTDVVLKASSADSLLVSFRCTSLLRKDKPGTHPYGRGAHHEGSSKGLAAEDATRCDDLDLLASEGRLVPLDELDNRWDENGGRNVTSVTTALTTLCTDDVNAGLDALLDVLGVTDHVHVGDAVGVKLVYDGLRGNTDGGDEKLCTRFDDDVDELVQLASGVVVVGGTRAPADFGKEKIDTKGRIGVLEEGLELSDL
jgi:hypothetical protein